MRVRRMNLHLVLGLEENSSWNWTKYCVIAFGRQNSQLFDLTALKTIQIIRTKNCIKLIPGAPSAEMTSWAESSNKTSLQTTFRPTLLLFDSVTFSLTFSSLRSLLSVSVTFWPSFLALSMVGVEIKRTRSPIDLRSRRKTWKKFVNISNWKIS